ncbi:MAG TPA: radical SAM protein, partial [Myxococcaceae bacterium]|nr:radical SAM protein [Myxococcaceae bacterium]
MSPSRTPALLVADPSGKVLEHPRLLATVRSGDEVLLPPEPAIPLPEGGRLVHLPGRRPVGVDPETGELVLVSEFQAGRRRFVPHAVGALVPPGWTRTYLPGEVKADGPVLPQWAYTAAGWDRERGTAVAWALHTDR